MFSQNGLYSQKTPQEQMMQQRQDAFFGAQAQSGGQMVPPAPQHVQMGMGTNPFGNAAGVKYLEPYINDVDILPRIVHSKADEVRKVA